MEPYVQDPYRLLPVIDDDFTPMWRVLLFSPGGFASVPDASAPPGLIDPDTGAPYDQLVETKSASVTLASWSEFITNVESSSSTTQNRHSEAVITLESPDGSVLDNPELVEGLFVRIDLGYSNTNSGPNFGPVFFGKIARVEPEFSKGVTVSVTCQPVEADYTEHQIRYDMPVGVTSGTVAKYLADYMGMAISMPLSTPEAPAGYNFGIGSPIYLMYRMASAVGYRFWVDNYVIYFTDEQISREGPGTAIFSYGGHERNIWSAQISYDPMASNALHQFGNIDSETGEVILESSGTSAEPTVSAENPNSETQIKEGRDALLSRDEILLGDAQRAPIKPSDFDPGIFPQSVLDAVNKLTPPSNTLYPPPPNAVDVIADDQGIHWAQKSGSDKTPSPFWKVFVEMENLPQTKKEAKQLADAVSDVKKFPHILTMETVGTWVTRPGDKIFIRGLCQRFDGDWLVDEITHKCSGRSFRSMIKARKNLLYQPKQSATPRTIPYRPWEEIEREASLAYRANWTRRKKQETLEIVQGRVKNMEKFLSEQGARLDLAELPSSFQSPANATHNAFQDELHKRLGLKAEVMPEGYTIYRPDVGSIIYAELDESQNPYGIDAPTSLPIVEDLDTLEADLGFVDVARLKVGRNLYRYSDNGQRLSEQNGFLVVCFNQPLERIGAVKAVDRQTSYWLIHKLDMPAFRRLVVDMHRDSRELSRWEAELEDQS